MAPRVVYLDLVFVSGARARVLPREPLFEALEALEARSHAVTLETTGGKRTFSLDVGKPP